MSRQEMLLNQMLSVVIVYNYKPKHIPKINETILISLSMSNKRIIKSFKFRWIVKVHRFKWIDSAYDYGWAPDIVGSKDSRPIWVKY